MMQYLLIGVAALVIVNGQSLEALVPSGQAADYLVAVGVALLLKPWLQGHFE